MKPLRRFLKQKARILLIMFFPFLIVGLFIKKPSNVFAQSTLGVLRSKSLNITSIDVVFYDPFGYLGVSQYQPRITYDNYGNLIENTDYGVKNPDLGTGITCFDQPFDQLRHAGEDLYYKDRNISTAGSAVTAVAPGFVLYSPTDIWYPGSVIIIQHSTSYGYVYSVYAHIDSSTVQVYDKV